MPTPQSESGSLQNRHAGGRTNHLPDSTKSEQTKSDQVGGSSGPTATKDSSVQPGDSTKAQNDVRDPSNPTTDPEKSEAKKDVDDSGKEPPAVDGPGPKPIETLAKENGGDAGKASSSDVALNKKDSAPAEEEEDGPQKKSTGEGTGEQWVKSSGLKADGGDFDAANPGAGKEADRECYAPSTAKREPISH
jgi:hypothetical protein